MSKNSKCHYIYNTYIYTKWQTVRKVVLWLEVLMHKYKTARWLVVTSYTGYSNPHCLNGPDGRGIITTATTIILKHNSPSTKIDGDRETA